MKLLVISEPNFQDIELTTVIGVLDMAGIKEKVDYYHPTLKSVTGQHNVLTLNNLINEVNINDYDAVFVPGGRGCQSLRTNKQSLNLIQSFLDANKAVYAICDAPNALFEAGIIKEDESYSSYPSNWTSWGKNRNEEYVTLTRKNFLTGKCPAASFEFAIAVVKHFAGEEVANVTYESMSTNKATCGCKN